MTTNKTMTMREKTENIVITYCRQDEVNINGLSNTLESLFTSELEDIAKEIETLLPEHEECGCAGMDKALDIIKEHIGEEK